MAYLRIGSGEPLLFLPGLTNHHRPPRGMDRIAAVQQLRPLARSRDVWWVNRRAGLTASVTIADLANDYAEGIRLWFGGPLDVLGVSTGGSVGLQLAADHPELVRTLVLAASGSRLGSVGRRAQRAAATSLYRGDRRGAGAAMFSILGDRRITRWVWAALGWLAGPVLFRDGAPDMCATIEAEDVFDLTARLPEIHVPVLLIGGDQDAPYGVDIFQQTVHGLPSARLLLYPRTGHLGVLARRRFAPDVLGFLEAR
ncbi:MAG: alpha/beta hydrolase [Jiangellaceae bacterium]|nr:alpha/beta hydrolase [Jiangellaceae bacterium]